MLSADKCLLKFRTNQLSNTPMNIRFRVLLAVGLLSNCVLWGGEAVAGKQIEQQLQLPNGKSVSYLLYLPREYDSKDKWPLMLFLHGRGESRGPLSVVKKWGPPRLIERGENFPFLIVSPQCPEAESWPQPQQQATLLALLDQLSKNYKVDDTRIYLAGLSMGGFGAWRLAADHPERFAAIVPICGGGKVDDADKLKSLPIWVFHGTADPTVPLQRSTEMVEAIKKAGGANIRFTTLEGIGHNSWEAAFACPDLYQWLDKQVSSKSAAH
jgi:predicted peptidase